MKDEITERDQYLESVQVICGALKSKKFIPKNMGDEWDEARCESEARDMAKWFKEMFPEEEIVIQTTYSIYRIYE